MNNILENFYGPNAGYVQDLYERYTQDPTTVSADARAFFARWSPDTDTLAKPLKKETTALSHGKGASGSIEIEKKKETAGLSQTEVADIVAACSLAHAIRERGHLGAHLDPLGKEPLGDPALLPETYGITDNDLSLLPPQVVGGHAAEGVNNALEAINALRAMYSGTISYEFDQVKSADERAWLRDAVGLRQYHRPPTPAEAHRLLKRLTQVEVLERYLHQIFPGQKRFSIEGTDTLVPMLDEIISGAVDSET